MPTAHASPHHGVLGLGTACSCWSPFVCGMPACMHVREYTYMREGAAGAHKQVRCAWSAMKCTNALHTRELPIPACMQTARAVPRHAGSLACCPDPTTHVLLPCCCPTRVPLCTSLGPGALPTWQPDCNGCSRTLFLSICVCLLHGPGAVQQVPCLQSRGRCAGPLARQARV